MEREIFKEEFTMQKRSIGLSIVLSIVTCGIYGIYWFVVLTNEVNAASGKQDVSGGVAVLLDIVTCGIYGIYWSYKMGEKIQTIKANRNMPADSNLPILYLILSIVGLQLVTWALIQNELNQMTEA
jgi:hypothetical protein